MAGIDAGIIVLKQLVDQEKWIAVLHAIGETCADVPQFPNHTSYNDYRSFTLQELSALKFTEKFNFHASQCYIENLDIESGKTVLCQALFNQLTEPAVTQVTCSAKVVCDIIIVTFCEHMFSGWLCNSPGKHNNSISNATIKKVKMNYFDKLISRYSYPPIAYFFDIGGFLCFPLFCRHFKSQVIRMRVNTQLMAREVLEKCFTILQEYFPDNICYFEEPTSKDYNHSHMTCHQPA